MNLFFGNLNKNQINIIKGIGILLIVFHNYLHVVTGTIENEMNYSYSNFLTLLNIIVEEPTASINGLFSYFGHFGVQLFIFASGYGLTKQFISKKISYKDYIITRLVKIYSLIIFGLAIYLIFASTRNEPEYLIEVSVRSLLMINNFSYETIFKYIGSWWFFSLIIQLYLIFPFLYKLIERKKEKGIIFLFLTSYLFIYLLFPLTEKAGIPLFGSFLGHLPVFLLGIGLAKFTNFKLNAKYLLVTLLIFILSNLTEYAFPFSFISATILMLSIFYPIYQNTKNNLAKVLISVGQISMFIFVINGPVRIIIIPLFSGRGPLIDLMGSCLHLIVVLIASYIMSFIYSRTMHIWSEKLIQKLTHHPKGKN